MSMIDSNPFIHPTAIVDKGAYIGNFTKIWHWTHISSEAKIGENCTLGQNVFIGNKVKIGNNVKVQNNVSIEDDVFCGPSVVFTNVYNPRSKINRKNEYKKTLIKNGASIGANATIICGNTIGSFAFIGAGAVVNKDVKPYSLLVGVPAKQIGWISSYGERIRLPLIGEGEWKCKKTGEVYILEFDQIKLKT